MLFLFLLLPFLPEQFSPKAIRVELTERGFCKESGRATVAQSVGVGARARWAGRRVTQYRVPGSKMGEEHAGTAVAT